MSFIQNIQKTMVFNAIEGLLNGLKSVAYITPTPWDELAVLTLLGIIKALREANTKDEALQAVASAIPDDTVG